MMKIHLCGGERRETLRVTCNSRNINIDHWPALPATLVCLANNNHKHTQKSSIETNKRAMTFLMIQESEWNSRLYWGRMCVLIKRMCPRWYPDGISLLVTNGMVQFYLLMQTMEFPYYLLPSWLRLSRRTICLEQAESDQTEQVPGHSQHFCLGTHHHQDWP